MLSVSLGVFLLARKYDEIAAFFAAFDASLGAWSGHTHPYGGFGSEDATDVFDEEALQAWIAGVSSHRSRRNGVIYSHFVQNGRRVDVAVMGTPPPSTSTQASKPAVVINAGNIAAARPLMVALSRAGCVVIAYTHGGLQLPDGTHSSVQNPAYSQFGTAFSATGIFMGGLVQRCLNTVAHYLKGTGDPLPLHSTLLMPQEEASPAHTPTSEFQSRELASVLSHCGVDRAVLVSSQYHWLSTMKCALRNKDHVAGVVCVDPLFPSTTPRMVLPQSTLQAAVAEAENAAGVDSSRPGGPKSTGAASSSTSTTAAGVTCLPPTRMEAAVLADVVKFRHPAPLVGALQPLLGLPAAMLFAPQQLAAGNSSMPSSLQKILSQQADSAGTDASKAQKPKPGGVFSAHEVFLNGVVPSLNQLRSATSVGGADILDAAFYRSQVVGAGLGAHGIIPPWTFGPQVASADPWYSRWLGIGGLVHTEYFKKLQEVKQQAGTSGHASEFGNSVRPTGTVSHAGNDANHLVAGSLGLELAGARSPFLDLVRLSAVAYNSPTLRVGSANNVLHSLASQMAGARLPSSAGYITDGAAFGTAFATLLEGLRHRHLALEQKQTYSPTTDADARSGYVVNMIECLKAENHVYTLIEQASAAIESEIQRSNAAAAASRTAIGGLGWFAGAGNAASAGSTRQPASITTDSDAVVTVERILARWASLPLDAASLSASPLKGCLVSLSLAQAGVTLPTLGSRPAANGKPWLPVAALIESNGPQADSGIRPGFVSAFATQLRSEAMLRAVAGLQQKSSPLLLSASLDSAVDRLRVVAIGSSSNNVNSSSSARDAGTSDGASSLATLTNQYCDSIVRWTPPVSWNYSAHRWNIPLHMLDRFASAVEQVSPATLMQPGVRKSPTLQQATNKLAAAMVGSMHAAGALGAGGRSGGSGGAKEKATISDAGSGPDPLVPVTMTMSITGFQGLLAWVHANMGTAKSALQWKYAADEAEHSSKGANDVDTASFIPKETSVPFPVSILVTEQADSTLMEPAAGPAGVDQDIALSPSLTGISASAKTTGMTLMPLGPPHPILLHTRLLIQAHQRLIRAAWSKALPDCVTVLPAETAKDVQRMINDCSSVMKGKVEASAQYWWPGLLMDRGHITATVKDATLPPDHASRIRSVVGKDTSNYSEPASKPGVGAWPALVDYSAGDPNDPMTAMADVVAYGPPQPYRPPLHSVVQEVMMMVDIETRRQRATEGQ